MTQTDEGIYHVLGLKESILWKQLYCLKQSTASVQSLSNYQWHFSQNYYRTKIFTIRMETQKTSNSQNNLKKEEWSWRNQTSWLQTILPVLTIKNVCRYCWKEQSQLIEKQYLQVHRWFLLFQIWNSKLELHK